jgi:hypothetical protein
MRGSQRTVAALLVVALGVGCAGRGRGARATDPMADFDARVRAYAALHRRLEHDLPQLAPAADGAAIEGRRKALAAKLRDTAGPPGGPIFTPPIGAAFRERLAAVTTGASGRNVRGSILDDNPAGIPVTAFAPYPATVLSTVPKPVLDVLPPLPEEVEYRFVGRALILRDVCANFVVDVLPDAFP